MLHKTIGPKLLTSIKNHPSSSEDVLACNSCFRVLKSVEVEVADELVVMLNLFRAFVRTFLLVNNLFLPMTLARVLTKIMKFFTVQVLSHKLVVHLRIVSTVVKVW